MAKKCVVNKNDSGEITTVKVPNPVNKKNNILSKISEKYNVLLNKMGFLIDNNSVEAIKDYGDLSKIAKMAGMTIAITQNKNYKIYTDLLTNTIYINQDTQINQSDIDSMLSELYRKYGTKDINKIGKEIIKKRDKLVFKEFKEVVFSNLNRSKTVEEIFNSYIDGADYVEVTSDKGDVRIFYDNNDQYPEQDIAEMTGDTFKVKAVTMGAKMGATNFHKIGDVQITQKVKHSLTAYNDRTLKNIIEYWNEVWSNNKVLTESATTRTEKFKSDVYIELSDETPYMGVSPYDNYSISQKSTNPVLQNVKYITRSIIDTDPQAVKEAVENTRDYEEWLVNVSPANIERIVFKDLEEAQTEGRILNNRWGIEVSTSAKSNKAGTYEIEGVPRLNIVYIYGVAYNLTDSDGNEYRLFNKGKSFYITNDSNSVMKELTRDEYMKIKLDLSHKITDYLKQKDELKTVFPRKIVQDVMFQNETSSDNLNQTPQEILKGVTDILLEKGLVDNIEILDLESLEKLKLENPNFKNVGQFNGAYDSSTKTIYIVEKYKNPSQILSEMIDQNLISKKC